MGRGRKRKIVKDTAKKGTIHQFYNSTRPGSMKVRYNPLKENDELKLKLQQSSRSVSKTKTIEQCGSKRAKNSEAPKPQSSERQIKGNK